MHQRNTVKKNAHIQRGVYAVEWALVFPVFFILVYAIISYGLTFLVRESMQNAVEEGARAALRYQEQRENRFDAAKEVVLERLSWLPSGLRPERDQVSVELCNLSQDEGCSPLQQCDVSASKGCLIKIALVIPDSEMPYNKVALAPALPGFEFFLPETLAASASILVDPGGF